MYWNWGGFVLHYGGIELGRIGVLGGGFGDYSWVWGLGIQKLDWVVASECLAAGVDVDGGTSFLVLG